MNDTRITKAQAFAKLPIIQQNDRILLISHNDLDGSGPAVLLKSIFDNVTIQHCGNGIMSKVIKNAVTYNETASKYDIIIACDISCNMLDAMLINKSPNKKKFILLDHHHTADELNRYKWACVRTHAFEDSFRLSYYASDEAANALTSGTALLYDYLDYHGYTSHFENQELVKEFVHRVASYDNWDWVYHFDKDEKFSQMDTLFGIYGADMFEENMIKQLSSATTTELLTDMDNMLLTIEKRKIEKHIQNVSKTIKTGNLFLNDEYYSVVFCYAESYLPDTFDYMKEHYDDYDLYMIDYGLGLSLRTTKSDIDVGTLMKEIGGGGHKEAAGIRHKFDNRVHLIETTLQALLFVDKDEDNAS